jgi:MFS family permease
MVQCHRGRHHEPRRKRKLGLHFERGRYDTGSVNIRHLHGTRYCSKRSRFDGLCTSLYVSGGVSGLIFAAWASDRFGRIRTLEILGAVAVIVCILTSAAQNICMFPVGRTLTGYGGWAMLSTVAFWSGEVAAPAVRGALMYLTMGLTAFCGYMGSAGIGYAFFHLPGATNMSWRGPLLFQFLFLAIEFSTIWF